jgi:hypothetical protein
MEALEGELDLMQKLWEWAKENLTKEEIKNNLLLHTDSDGKTAWHVVARYGEVGVMEKIWESAKYDLTIEEIKLVCY